MSKVVLKLFLISALMTSCKGEGTVPTGEGNTIELVALGIAATPTEANKGYGIAYYCYLNLENDSVYIQRKVDPLEAPRMVAWVGTVEGLVENDTIQALIEATHIKGNGRIKSNSSPEHSLNDRYAYVLSYKQANDEKLFYSTNNLDRRIEIATDYIIHLQYNSELNRVASVVHEDSVVVPLLNKEGFDLPPPPVKAIIKYIPPLEE